MKLKICFQIGIHSDHFLLHGCRSFDYIGNSSDRTLDRCWIWRTLKVQGDVSLWKKNEFINIFNYYIDMKLPTSILLTGMWVTFVLVSSFEAYGMINGFWIINEKSSCHIYSCPCESQFSSSVWALSQFRKKGPFWYVKKKVNARWRSNIPCRRDMLPPSWRFKKVSYFFNNRNQGSLLKVK